ncbi:MAG TPA: diguanylate cyclase [Acidobacteriaceae bacterium]|jgi:diguanylate cyclase (GGDEF)-like protein|nr:diguanylate cyclase [Acidobacteriaceae bacterium]
MAEIRNTRALLSGTSLSSGAVLQSGTASISAETDRLAAITQDNPRQQKNLADFRTALARAQSDPSGAPNSAEIASADLILDRMTREEYRLLSDRMSRQTEATRNGAYAACAFCFVLLVLSVATASAATIEYRRREIAESALQGEKLELTLYSRDLALVSAGGGLIQAAQKESEIQAAAVQTIREMFPDSRGFLGIVSPDRESVHISAHWGEKPTWLPFSPSECLALSSGNMVHRSRWPLQVCAAHPGLPDQDQICIPIRTASGLPGLLHLETTMALNAKRADVLAIFASHIGLGLTNLKMREALKRDSIHDPLTGLFNRRYFDETLVHELARAHRQHMPLSFLILDFDHFKVLNDTHGHLAGDDALRAFARIFRTTFRAGDVLCRYGGEEFAVLLPGADLEHAWAKAEAFRFAVQQAKLTSNGNSLGPVSVSVGIASSVDFETPHALLRAADAALYQAKRTGRNASWACTCRSVPFPAIDCPTTRDQNSPPAPELPSSPSVLLSKS